MLHTLMAKPLLTFWGEDKEAADTRQQTARFTAVWLLPLLPQRRRSQMRVPETDPRRGSWRMDGKPSRGGQYLVPTRPST
ncbi:hypothetical protein CapIbe_022638 [Capra ibex]